MSALTTGRLLLPGLDARSAVSRRYRDLSNIIANDRGGAENLSEMELQLIRRFAGCTVLSEQLEAQIVNGEPIDLDAYSKLISSSVRIARRLGLSRVPKDITPSLSQYLASKNGYDVGDVGDRGDDGT